MSKWGREAKHVMYWDLKKIGMSPGSTFVWVYAVTKKVSACAMVSSFIRVFQEAQCQRHCCLAFNELTDANFSTRNFEASSLRTLPVDCAQGQKTYLLWHISHKWNWKKERMGSPKSFFFLFAMPLVYKILEAPQVTVSLLPLSGTPKKEETKLEDHNDI